MARRPALDDRALQFEYRFDRLLPQKLEQVFEVLVPSHTSTDWIFGI